MKTGNAATFIGLDIDDQWTHGCAHNDKSGVGECKRMSTQKMEWLEWIRKQPSPRYVMFEESTLAQWFFEKLTEECEVVIVSEPRENAWINKSNKKSDSRDAQKLAELLRLRRYKAVYHSTDPQRVELRRQARHYVTMNKKSAAWKCRIKCRFKEFGIFPDASLFDSEKRKDWMKKLPKGAVRARIEREFEVHDLLTKQKEAALHSMNAYANRFPEVKMIRQIPGVGPVGAPLFVGFLMDPHRFAERQKLWTYCRLGITSRESGGKKICRDRIDKWNGHGILKSISRTAFLSAQRSENVFHEFYSKKCASMAAHKARLSTQRKIMTIAWKVWLNKEAFDSCRVI